MKVIACLIASKSVGDAIVGKHMNRNVYHICVIADWMLVEAKFDLEDTGGCDYRFV